MITEVLFGVVIALLIVLIFLTLRRIEPDDVESAVSKAWIGSGLDKSVGELATYAQDIRNDYRSLDRMLRVPTGRASLGEIALETILSDQLPPEMFGIRARIFDGKIPDAHIRSTVGIVCIDSKFPLDNYRKMVETTVSGEKELFKKQFLRDIQGHLNKIAEDYVRPEAGSAEFAFAFIPSEGVYYFLVKEFYDLLKGYVKRGVQVVSPLMLSHKIELIKAGVHAKKFSEQAEKVRNDMIDLSRQFGEVDEKWRIFYDTHLRNTEKKAEELDRAYKKLREDFDRISEWR